MLFFQRLNYSNNLNLLIFKKIDAYYLIYFLNVKYYMLKNQYKIFKFLDI